MSTRALPQTLSSPLTFPIKWFFPVVWSGGWGIGTLQFLLHPAPVWINGGPRPAPPGFGLLLCAAWIAGTVLSLLFGWGLKRVRLTDGELLISNYLREIRVPLRDVAAVRRRLFPHSRGIALDFMVTTPFGRSVSFIAGGTVTLGPTATLVDDLRRRVAASRAV